MHVGGNKQTVPHFSYNYITLACEYFMCILEYCFLKIRKKMKLKKNRTSYLVSKWKPKSEPKCWLSIIHRHCYADIYSTENY